MPQLTDRELTADAANPLEMDGIEFVEYATSRPQSLGQVLEMMGFRPIARHRSVVGWKARAFMPDGHR